MENAEDIASEGAGTREEESGTIGRLKLRLLKYGWVQKLVVVFNRVRRRLPDRNYWKPLLWAVGSIVLAILVSILLMTIMGYDVILGFEHLIRGAIDQPDRILQYATPLILTGLSVALAFKCGLFNIGPEGQLLIGSMAAAILGYVIALPFLVHPLVCIGVAAVAGGLWGLLPGLLRAYRGAHEVVTTMMLSYVAINFTQYLASGPLKERGPYEWISQTTRILETAELAKIGGPYLHWGIGVAIVCVIGVDFLLKRTVLGYEMKAVGLNEQAAEYAGINSKWRMALALGISGALAGIGGAGEILGTHRRFLDGWSGGLGWDGITVAVLGNNSPWGVLGAAIFFGALRAGGNRMHQIAEVPIEIVGLIQGLVVVFVAAPRIIDWMGRNSADSVDWLKRNPKEAIPGISVLVYNLFGLFLGVGLSISVISINPFLGMLLSLLGILSGLVVYRILALREAELTLSALPAFAWVVAVLLDATIGGWTFFNTGLVMALAGLILTVVFWMIYALTEQSEGGTE
ncbi:MAG: ABC transporter permease [Candidatus Thorarchaeota archaeon]